MSLRTDPVIPSGALYSFVDSARRRARGVRAHFLPTGRFLAATRSSTTSRLLYRGLKSGEAVAQEFIGVNPSGLSGLSAAATSTASVTAWWRAWRTWCWNSTTIWRFWTTRPTGGRHGAVCGGVPAQLLMYAEAIGGGVQKAGDAAFAVQLCAGGGDHSGPGVKREHPAPNAAAFGAR